MIFLNFATEDGKHEWGFNAKEYYIPAVGDTVALWYGPPDKEDIDGIEAIVIERVWWFANDFREENRVSFTVRLKMPIPVGYMASSTEWPAITASERDKESQEELKRLKERLRANK